MVRPMVHSTKHYAQLTFSTAATGATAIFSPVISVTRTAANASIEVAEGSTVKAIYMELWVIADAVDQFFTIILAKLPGGVGNIIQADMVDLFAYDNKKNIFYSSQGLTPQESSSNPIPVYRGWLKIPKSKQRFGLGDRIQLAVASRGTDNTHFCGLFIYKEYS